MRTHGDYRKQIDKIMGIERDDRPAAPHNESREMTKLKRKLRDQKIINKSLRGVIDEHKKPKPGSN